MRNLHAFMNNSAKRQKVLYDTRIHTNQYESGDFLWLETDISQLDITSKLWDPFEGLYMIYKRLCALDYELYMDRRKRKVVHHNQLKPCLGLKWPPGYYCALKDAKRDVPQPQISVQSRQQRVAPLCQVAVQLCRQWDSPLPLICACTGESLSCFRSPSSPGRMAVLPSFLVDSSSYSFYRCSWFNLMCKLQQKQRELQEQQLEL